MAVAAELARLVALTERLRGPGGCPWDAAQTHHSLRRHVLEEAYEVAAAIDELPADAPDGDIPLGAYDALEDELGDLLFQVMIHSVLAAEAGAFTIADVARARARRSSCTAIRTCSATSTGRADADAVVTNWEQIKKAEKGHDSLVEGITPGLPSLLYAQKLFRKASSVGLAPELDTAPIESPTKTLGDALGRARGRGRAAGHRRRVGAERRGRGASATGSSAMEQLAAAAGVDLASADAAAVERLWLEAASREADS